MECAYVYACVCVFFLPVADVLLALRPIPRTRHIPSEYLLLIGANNEERGMVVIHSTQQRGQ